jgi:N-hydroxyarylamine O-acetyltransferase
VQPFPLDDYLRRIRFPRVASGSNLLPDKATLDAILRCHVEAIPFENLDVVRGLPIALDLPRIATKLIHQGRGGYCFEQNTLLLGALTALGYAASPLSARVRIGRARDFTPPRSHMFLRVELDGASWLVDAGVGGLSPTAALRLEVGSVQSTPHDARRLIATGNWAPDLGSRSPDATLIHQVQLGGEWQDVCEFTLEPMPEIDRIVANWYTSAHPNSHFKDRLMVARATARGRTTLLNGELTLRDASGNAHVTTLHTQAELREALLVHFGIELNDAIPCPGIPS